MPVDVELVTPDAELPAHADVVIAGGGIAGVATALFLAERGVRPVVCEKGEIAAEQSGRNWGWCRTMGRDPREIPLAIESLRLWRTMNDRIGAETGFRQCGTLYICPDRQSVEKREAWLPHAREHGIASRMLRGAEVHATLPGLAQDWQASLHTPEDGVAEPAMAVPAMARAAQRNGARVLTRCAVRGIELARGRVAAVITERGRIGCDRVVIAGGVWSTLLCRSLGLRLPQLGVIATVLRTAPVLDGPRVAAWGPGLALRPRLDGGYTVASGNVLAPITPDSLRFLRDFLPVLKAEWSGISLRFGRAFLEAWRDGRPWRDGPSAFELTRTLDPDPVAAEIASARRNLEAAFPAFRDAPTLSTWAGMIDATPDLLPVISDVAEVPGLYLSTGYSGHGFGIGLGAGQLMADMVTNTTPVVDPTPFRCSRFRDGSIVRPQAGL